MRTSRWNLSHWAIEHPWLTVGFWVAIAVAGILALGTLKYALFPEVRFPVVIVQGEWGGVTAEETVVGLTEPIERRLLDLADTQIYSSTYPGQGVISIAFPTWEPLTTATETVKTRLANLELPPGAQIKVFPFNLNESAAVTYAVKPSESEDLGAIAKILETQGRPALEAIDGVLRVNLLGDGELREPTLGAEQTLNLPTLTRYNGDPVLALEVIKTAQANTLEVVDQVEQVIQTLAPTLPQMTFIEAATQAVYIREATQATLEALLGAILLAILIIYPFLRNLRATLISAIAIPLSLLGTALVMAILGFNLETLTLLALALVIGIVVDDAIVDVENILRHLGEGLPLKTAAKIATQEIGFTVSATTFSIVVVFLPVALLGGTLGQFFFPFAVTVSAAVLFSWLVSRTLAPVLAVFWLRSPVTEQTPAGMGWLGNFYENCLGWALRHRWAVVGLAGASLMVGLALIPLIPQGFVPTLDRGEFNVVFESAPPKLAAGLTAPPPDRPPTSEDSSAFSWLGRLAANPQALLLRRGQRVADRLEGPILDNPAVASTFTTIGVQGNPLKGNIYVKLNGDRPVTTQTVQTQVRENLPDLPRVTTRVENILFVQTGDDAPVKLALLGEDGDLLATYGQQLKDKLTAIPGLVQVELTGLSQDGEAIERFQGQRALYLTASLLPSASLGDITPQITAIAKETLPAPITLDMQGESARAGSVLREFAVAFTLSVVGMITIFLVLFRRLMEPLVVALSLPLSLVGAMVGLLITQSEFGMISLIGLIFLLGLLDKNAILLIDYANQLRHQGQSRTQALLTTGRIRLRPILMTTSSTLLGMLPLALGLGAGAELRQPMAIAIMGGLFTSTLLSLVVVPVLYSLLDDLWPLLPSDSAP